MLCPICSEPIWVNQETVIENEGATLDCNNCDGLVLIENGLLKDFHKKLNQKDARWPANGENTHYVEF